MCAKARSRPFGPCGWLRECALHPIQGALNCVCNTRGDPPRRRPVYQPPPARRLTRSGRKNCRSDGRGVRDSNGRAPTSSRAALCAVGALLRPPLGRSDGALTAHGHRAILLVARCGGHASLIGRALDECGRLRSVLRKLVEVELAQQGGHIAFCREQRSAH
eukprot:scaffold23690_cov32-Tisochrysis_lutea.AAC.2